MKSCPTCNRTFEDSFSFCLVDGAILSAPFDPQATLVLPASSTSPPSETDSQQRTEETIPGLPPTTAAPTLPPPVVETAPTIAASELVDAGSAGSAAGPKPGRNPLLWVSVGVCALVVIGVFIAYAVGLNPWRQSTSKSSSPPAGPTRVEGSKWRTKILGPTDETWEFNPHGDFVFRRDLYVGGGTWTQNGDRVEINLPRTVMQQSGKIVGTINGGTITGTATMGSFPPDVIAFTATRTDP